MTTSHPVAVTVTVVTHTPAHVVVVPRSVINIIIIIIVVGVGCVVSVEIVKWVNRRLGRVGLCHAVTASRGTGTGSASIDVLLGRRGSFLHGQIQIDQTKVTVTV